MGTNLKPASSKAWELYKKLQALADRGIDGERISAQNKITRLKARFNFDIPAPIETPDLFFGSFKPSRTARRIYSFDTHETDVVNCVKWAIESATRLPCLYRDGELLIEATRGTANKLAKIADHIARSFHALLARFSAISGVTVTDRAAFVMGLYDGMMNEVRDAGQPLPSRHRTRKKPKAKTGPVARSPDLHIHPYSVAVNLGKQIRFSVPLEQITNDLDAILRKHLQARQT